MNPTLPSRPLSVGLNRAGTMSSISSTFTANTSISRANSVKMPEIAGEELYENQRGNCLFGEPDFSPLNLLPTDYPAWSNQRGDLEVDRLSFPTPSNWEWIDNWTIDMRVINSFCSASFLIRLF